MGHRGRVTAEDGLGGRRGGDRAGVHVSSPCASTWSWDSWVMNDKNSGSLRSWRCCGHRVRQPDILRAHPRDNPRRMYKYWRAEGDGSLGADPKSNCDCATSHAAGSGLEVAVNSRQKVRLPNREAFFAVSRPDAVATHTRSSWRPGVEQLAAGGCRRASPADWARRATVAAKRKVLSQRMHECGALCLPEVSVARSATATRPFPLQSGLRILDPEGPGTQSNFPFPLRGRPHPWT